MDLSLKPGETVELPKILIGAYLGNLDAGANAVRKYIYDSCISWFLPHQRVLPVSFDWLSLTMKYLNHYFEELGPEWIRWDFNMAFF